MKIHIRHILFTLAGIAILVSCSDWTKPESVRIKDSSLKEDNPELYRQYTESLRAYKASEHQVTIAKFDNRNTAPTGRSEHLTSLPDSIDLVILTDPDTLADHIATEMTQVRQEMGTKILYTISYNAIEQEWKALEDSGEKPHGDFDAYLGERTEHLISLFDKYGYDGICVLYTGKSPLGMTGTEKKQYQTRQEVFLGRILSWKNNHQEAIMLFEGNPSNLVCCMDILSSASYIILPALDASTFEDFGLCVRLASTEGVPTDRFIIGVTVPSLTDKTDSKGVFPGVSGESAIIGGAIWVYSGAAPAQMQGIAIDHAQNDYFNPYLTFRNIRTAIQIMNPSL